MIGCDGIFDQNTKSMDGEDENVDGNDSHGRLSLNDNDEEVIGKE